MLRILTITLATLCLSYTQAKAIDVQINASIRVVAALPMSETTDFEFNNLKNNASYSHDAFLTKRDKEASNVKDENIISASLFIASTYDDVVQVSCTKSAHYAYGENASINLTQANFIYPTDLATGQKSESCNGVDNVAASIDLAKKKHTTLYFGAEVNVSDSSIAHETGFTDSRDPMTVRVVYQ